MDVARTKHPDLSWPTVGGLFDGFASIDYWHPGIARSARELGIGEKRLRKLVREGRVAAEKFGGSGYLCLSRETLDGLLAGGIPTSQEISTTMP